jgi:hypothetical protein
MIPMVRKAYKMDPMIPDDPNGPTIQYYSYMRVIKAIVDGLYTSSKGMNIVISQLTLM